MSIQPNPALHALVRPSDGVPPWSWALERCKHGRSDDKLVDVRSVSDTQMAALLGFVPTTGRSGSLSSSANGDVFGMAPTARAVRTSAAWQTEQAWTLGHPMQSTL